MTECKGLIFLGPPGSGKGTQGQVLAESLKIPHISTGEILRKAIKDQTDLGKQAQTYMDRGELVPDHLLLDLIQERLKQPDSEKGWILDGFPRNVDQAAFLSKIVAEMPETSTQALNLEVPDEVLVKRLLQRGRKDDNEETIRNRLKVYREKTAPVLDYYQEREQLHSVDGDRQPTEVTQALKTFLEVGA